MNGNNLFLQLTLSLSLCLAVFAQNDLTTTNNDSTSTDSLFEKGDWEITLNSGALFSPFVAVNGRPTVNYSMTAVQIGKMLNNPSDDLWWRGNWEFVGELFAGTIFKGHGNYLAGNTLWLRYNFLPENCRIKPFAQAGMGLVFTDVDRRLVGQDFNFNLELGVGFRYFISRNWSANFEYRYQHISNANISDKNVGVNAQGPMLGISYYF